MKNVTSIAVVGLGYVGLPLALLADKKGFSVTGVDVNQALVDSLSKKIPTIDDVSPSDLKSASVTFTSDVTSVRAADAVIICVPTPVTHDKNPDLSPLKMAVASVAAHMKPKSLLVIESTINPGVCDEVVIPLIHSSTNKKVGTDIYLAHCPERINPGDTQWNVSNINRVLGANSAHELEIAHDMYTRLVAAEIKPMATIKEAEAVKVIENSFRDINIAFVNELAMSFHKLGINLENVIDGAATKPFAFMPHRPGCGVGGHCIPVDPYYLIEYASGFGFDHEFLRLARSINESMPQFTVDLLIEALSQFKKPLKDTKVSLLGLSYKGNVGDDRESPAYQIERLLRAHGADLTIYDPFISSGSTVNSLFGAIENCEAVIIATNHTQFKQLLKLTAKSKIKVIIDGRNMLRREKDTFTSQGIVYQGVGV